MWFSASGEPRQTIEFHLDTQRGVPVFIGREWASHDWQYCPWCATQTAMAFSVDDGSRQLILHLRNREGQTADLPLVHAHKWFLQFQSPEHTLTIELKRPNDLSITSSDGAHAVFHRY
jgi:hypothetical protein